MSNHKPSLDGWNGPYVDVPGADRLFELYASISAKWGFAENVAIGLVSRAQEEWPFDGHFAYQASDGSLWALRADATILKTSRKISILFPYVGPLLFFTKGEVDLNDLKLYVDKLALEAEAMLNEPPPNENDMGENS